MPGKSAATKGATRDGGSTTGVQRTRFVDGLRETDVVSVPLKDIDLADTTFQYRLITRTDDLRAAIAREGQVEPVDLSDSKPHRIIDGFRRIQAIKELGWDMVKAFVRHGIGDEAAHELAYVKNVVRRNLTVMEKANAIRLAKKRGAEPAKVAEAFGLSEKQLHRYEAVLDFPKPLQALLDADQISMAHAAVLARFDGIIDVVEWVEKVQDKKWSAAELRRELRKAISKRPAAKKRSFIKCEGDELRGYPWRISKSAGRDEKNRAIGVLEEAIRFLKDHGGVAQVGISPATSAGSNKRPQSKRGHS